MKGETAAPFFFPLSSKKTESGGWKADRHEEARSSVESMEILPSQREATMTALSSFKLNSIF